MARIQSRKSVSINKAVHELVRSHCADKNTSVSSFVERVLLEKIGTRSHMAKWKAHRENINSPLEF